VVFIIFNVLVVSQDPSIFGTFVVASSALDERAINNIIGKCFMGLGFLTCEPTVPSNKLLASYQLPYYKNMEDIVGTEYCLACCGTSPKHIDTWELNCPVTSATANQVNYFGRELRMARNQFSGDRKIIRCPLKRSNCNYNETGDVIGNCVNDGVTRLIGYTLTIEVERYNSQFVYWNAVKSCSIESVESTQTLPGAGQVFTFKETIVMKYPTLSFKKQPVDYIKIVVIILVVFLVVFILLYFCRKKHCVYCQQKLIINFTLCYKCQLLGVEMPDPVLLKAMEEKSLHLQGG
jgi:hypothetical protein